MTPFTLNLAGKQRADFDSKILSVEYMILWVLYPLHSQSVTLRSGESLSPMLNECILGKALNLRDSGLSLTCLQATLATRLESSPPAAIEQNESAS